MNYCRMKFWKTSGFYGKQYQYFYHSLKNILIGVFFFFSCMHGIYNLSVKESDSSVGIQKRNTDDQKSQRELCLTENCKWLLRQKGNGKVSNFKL